MAKIAPTVGRMVIYTYANGEEPGFTQRSVPAVVTGCHGEQRIPAEVGTDAPLRERVNLTIFPDLALPQLRGSVFEADEVGTPGTWAWPKFVPPGPAKT